mgnify:CR=1 FL=1
MNSQKVISIVLDDIKINNKNTENRISMSDVVIDLARPFYRNVFKFSSKKVKKICNNGDRPIYIDGDSIAAKYFERGRSEFLKWVTEKPNDKIFIKKSLKELFVYDKNISLWWLTRASHKNFNKTRLGTYFHQNIALKHIIQDNKRLILNGQEESFCIYLFCDTKEEYNYFAFVIRNYLLSAAGTCLKKNILFKSPYFLPKTNYSFFGLLEIVISTMKFIMHKVLIYRKSKVFNSHEPKIFDHMIATSFPRDWFPIDSRNNGVKRDRYLGEIYEALNNKGTRIAFLPVFHNLSDMEEWLSLRNLPNFVCLNLNVNQFFQIFIRFIVYQVWWYFIFLLLWRKSKLKLKSPMKDIDSSILLDHLLLLDMGETISRSCISKLFVYELFKKSLPLNVKSVILVQEFYSTSRVIKAALKDRETKVIGIQHSLGLLDQYYAYIISPIETGVGYMKNNSIKSYITFMPIPDYNLIFGSYYKKMIAKLNGYPKERLIVTGPTRNDNMVMNMRDFCDDKMISLKKTLDIPLNRKTIFLCTSPRDVRSTISLVLNAIKISKAQPFLVIKLHPTAIENVIDFNEFGFREFKDFIIISEQINQFMLISDVVVSQLSTVALESVLMGKPHIIISKDLSLKNSFIFSEQPLIMHTDKHKEASHMLDKLLLSDNNKDELFEYRKLFLKKYFDNEDGCALDRVNNFLVSL